MKIAVYSSHGFEKEFIKVANFKKHKLVWIEEAIDNETVNKSKGCKAIIIFSSDKIDKKILKKLNDLGVEFIAARSAGTDHIDLEAAKEFDIKVANVPDYSPNSIAEHCIALTLSIYRKLKPSFKRIENYNFTLEGQIGREINSKTVGIFGTGDIGEVLANLFHCFGAKVFLFDAKKNANLKEKSWAKYVSKEIF